jgi:hypothetical protein
MTLESLDIYLARDPALPVFRYIRANRVLELLVAQSTRTTRHIERVWRQTESLRSNISIITRMRWMLRKDAVRALRPEMESLKSLLSLVLGNVMLNSLLLRRDNSDVNRREMYTIYFALPPYNILLIFG